MKQSFSPIAIFMEEEEEILKVDLTRLDTLSEIDVDQVEYGYFSFFD